MKAPCMGCGKRSDGCHGECAEYREFQAYMARIREKRNEYLNAAWTEIDRSRRQRKDQGWSMKRGKF